MPERGIVGTTNSAWLKLLWPSLYLLHVHEMKSRDERWQYTRENKAIFLSLEILNEWNIAIPIWYRKNMLLHESRTIEIHSFEEFLFDSNKFTALQFIRIIIGTILMYRERDVCERYILFVIYKVRYLILGIYTSIILFIFKVLCADSVV